MHGVCGLLASLLVMVCVVGCASSPLPEPSRRAVQVIDVSFSDERGRMYDAEILVPSRANGAAAMLLGGGSVTDMSWTVPAQAEIDGRVVQFTTTGQAIRDADALAAALLRRGFHVLRWSSIHRDDPMRRENPAYAEGLDYEAVRGLARLALGELREHEATRGMPIVLIGHSLGAARALQIAAGQGDVAGLVLLAGAYVSPLAMTPSQMEAGVAERHGVRSAVGVEELSGSLGLLSALGVADAAALDVDGDGRVWLWEIAAAEVLAGLRRGDRTMLTDAGIRDEPHPGVLALESAVPVLAVFGGEDVMSLHGPVMRWLAEQRGSTMLTVRFEPGLGHGLGLVEPAPARDADVLAGVLGPMDPRVVEVVALWADGVAGTPR